MWVINPRIPSTVKYSMWVNKFRILENAARATTRYHQKDIIMEIIGVKRFIEKDPNRHLKMLPGKKIFHGCHSVVLFAHLRVK